MKKHTYDEGSFRERSFPKYNFIKNSGSAKKFFRSPLCPVILIELVILLATMALTLPGHHSVIPVEISGETADCESEALSIPRGAYRVYVNYSTDSDMTNMSEIICESPGYGQLLTNPTPMYAGKNHTEYLIWARSDLENLRIRITYGGVGFLSVSGASLAETNLLQRRNLTVLLLAFVIMDGVWLLDKAMKKEKKAFALVMAAILISSAPLCLDYLISGADLGFHLLRIEGIKDGLLQGEFPVRIHPNWLQGHGYAVSFFYCDLFLYFPAFLRIMGFTVQGAYLCYKLLINCMTAGIAYYSFSRLSDDRMIGAYGSLLYTFGSVRLIYLYEVDGVGMYTAMAFLPLVLYGLWRILREDARRKDPSFEKTDREDGSGLRYREKPSWIPLALGMTGVVQSHVLSTEMTLGFLVIGALLCGRAFFRREVLVHVFLAALATTLLSLWFVVPFLDEMRSMDFAVMEGGAALKQIQTWGMYLPQMFFSFLPGGLHGMTNAAHGMQAENAFGTGLGLSLILIAAGAGYRKVLDKTGRILFALAVLSIYAASVYFPWDRLAQLNPLLRKVIAPLQFPARITMMTLVLLSALACILAAKLRQNGVEGIRRSRQLMLITALGALLSGCFLYESALIDSENHFRIYDETCMGNGYVSGGEYLLLGTDTAGLTYRAPVVSGAVLENWEKHGTTVTMTLRDVTDGFYAELPLLYYKGYQTSFDGDASDMQVTCGENNLVRVSFHEKPDESALRSDQAATLTVRFAGFWYWRAAEVISLAAFGGILWLGIRGIPKGKGGRKTPEGIEVGKP